MNITIKQISYDECLVLWKLLWANRVSPIEPTSAMVFFPSCKGGVYSTNIGTPTFIGAFVDDVLVGVNSLHKIDNTVRSRGLYVLGEFRGNGIAKALLINTIERAGGEKVWSYPNVVALPVYLKAGFKIASDAIHDPIENKWNHYVNT